MIKIASSFLQTFSNTQHVLLYLKSAIDPQLIIPLFHLFADVKQIAQSHACGGETRDKPKERLCRG